MINDQTLPTKSQLIKVLKEQMFVDYRIFKLDGVKNIKERIIMLIFIYHSIVGRTDQIQCRESFKSQVQRQASLIIGGLPEHFIDDNPEELLRLLFLELIKDRP